MTSSSYDLSDPSFWTLYKDGVSAVFFYKVLVYLHLQPLDHTSFIFQSSRKRVLAHHAFFKYSPCSFKPCDYPSREPNSSGCIKKLSKRSLVWTNTWRISTIQRLHATGPSLPGKFDGSHPVDSRWPCWGRRRSLPKSTQCRMGCVQLLPTRRRGF